MDLKGQAKLIHEYVINPNTSEATITLKDASDTTLGEIVIEEARLRPFLEGLTAVVTSMYDEYAQNIQDHRTSVNINEGKATTEFF